MSPAHIRLAVLPFHNLTGPEDEHFSDGLTEELISCLCRLAGDRLTVIARTSVGQYKRSLKSVDRIGRELDVNYILEGSVRRAGPRLCITTQLIRVQDQSHVWAESYDRNLSDVLTVQNHVARAVSDKIVLTMDRVPRVARPRPVKPEAYEAHLKGLYHRNQFTREGFDKALTYHQHAVQADPSHALTWAGLALAHAMVSHCDLPARKPRDAFAHVERAARRALELDDALAEAHLALGELRLYYEWDWAGAEHALDRALALNPNLAEAHRHHGWYELLIGRPDEALKDLRKAKNLEPVAPLYTAELGWVHLARGEFGSATDEALQALELDEDFPVGLFVLGFVALQQGKVDEAIDAHGKAVRTSRGWQWALGYTLAVSGRTDKTRELQIELGSGPADAWSAWTLACVASGLGDTDRACDALAAAFDLRHSWMPWVDTAPMFGPLHKELRFQELVHRLNLPQRVAATRPQSQATPARLSLGHRTPENERC